MFSSRRWSSPLGLSQLRFAVLLAALASVTLLSMPTFASAAGTLKAVKGGDRNIGNTGVSTYALGVVGATFEYTTDSTKASTIGSTGWTAFPNATDVTGATTVSVPAGTYYVREAATMGGFANFGPVQSLTYDPNDSTPTTPQPYVAKVTVQDGQTSTAYPHRTLGTPSGWETTSGGSSGSPFINVRDNAVFPNTCGLNILLVLDRSGSIDPYKDTYRLAARGLVDALSDTPTQIGIVSFNASANSYQDGSGTASYTSSPLTLGDAGQTNENALKTTIDNVYNAPTGGTNWDIALQKASAAAGFTTDVTTGQTTKPDVVVFITDGNPTANSTTDTDAGSNVDLLDLTAGMASGNSVKNTLARPGTNVKLYAVGVENVPGSGSVNLDALKSVSNKIAGEDYENPTAAGLQAKLTEIAARTCGARVFIRKRVTGSATDQSGWTFTGSSTGGSQTYLDNNATTHSTLTGVQTGVILTKLPAGTSNVTINENVSGQPLANFTLTNKVCRTGSYDGADVVPVSTTSTGLTVGVTRGATLYCTFTNTQQTGSIELVKSWAGGDPGQTTLNIGTSAGGSQTDTQLTGAAGAAPLTTGANTVPVGTYYVSETGGLSNYNSSLACTKNGNAYTPGANNAIAVGNNDVVVCTYTNTRKQGSVELKKSWAGGDPGQTTLNIGTSAGGSQIDTQLTGAAGAAPLTTGANSVPTGTYYVSESGGLSNYNSTLACTKNGNAYTPGANSSLVVAENDVVVCTYTNTRKKGSIELKKAWAGGDPGQTTLNIGTSIGGNQVDTQQTGAAGAAPLTTDANSVPTGTYYVSETGGLSNYNSSLACTKNGNAYTPGANDAVVVAENDVVVCTYTNTRKKGSIELQKTWAGGDPGQTTLNIGTSAGGSDTDTQLTGAAGAAPLSTGANSVPTGTYYVSESGGLSNYNSTLACTKNGNAYTPGASNAIAVGENDVVVCVYTNTRKKASIELVKSWAGGDPGQTTLNIGTSIGGSQVDTQLTGAAGAAPLTTGANTVNTGTYYVSESGGLSNYTSSLACTKNGNAYSPGANDAVTVAENDVVVCTYTNTRKKGSIELKKAWAGGDPGQTTLNIGTSIGGSQVDTQLTGAAGAAPLTTDANNVPTGTYYVSESGGLANYTTALSCTKNGNAYTPGAGGSVVVGENDTVVCTYTNTRKKGSIELQKVWAGGDPGQTTLNIGTSIGGSQTDTQVTGAAGAAPLSTGANSVATGTYYVSETGGLANYNSSLACTKNGNAYTPGLDGSVTVGENDTVLCVYTNTRKKGSIELKKAWAGGDPGQTTLNIGTSAGGSQTDTQLTGAAGAAPLTTGANSVATGTYYVSESGGLSNYTSALSCIKNGNAYTPGANDAVTVAENDVVVCTYTNTRKKASIELKKSWAGGDPGQTTLNIGTSAGGSQVDTQLTGAAGAAPLTTDANTVNTGTYYVSESGGLSNYNSSLACTKNGNAYTPGANDAVTVAENDVVVCTYTNTRKKGSIELKKAWAGGDPGQTTLNIGTSVGGSQVDTQLTGAAGAAPLTTDANSVPTGTYYVSESGGLSNYDGALTCTKNGNAYTPGANDAVTVAENDVVVCTYTNTRKKGSIELKKVWSGTGGQTTLNIGTSAGGSQVDSQQTGANGAGPLTTDANVVNTGTYYVSESGGLSNYDSSLACTKNGNAYTPGANDAVTVGKDDVVVCTYTNTRKTGTIKLVKELNGGGSDTFNLKINGVNQSKSGGGTGFGDGDATAVLTKDTGTYTVSESAVAPATDGQYDESLSCVNNGAGAADTDGSIDIAKGDNWVCTFTNTRRQGSIELKKVWSGTGGQTTLKIGTSAGGSQVDSQQTGANGAGPLTTGNNTVNTGTYYVSESGGLADYDSELACTKNGNAYTPGADDSVVVGQSDSVVCTYTNTRKTGTIKLVKELNGGGSDTFNLKINGVNQSKSGGGTGFGDGDATAVLTKDTGTYTVSESAVAPATDGQYDQSVSCVNGTQPGADTDGTVDIAKGDNWVCTFTNTRRTGTLELVKKLEGGGSDTFHLKIDGTNQDKTGGGTAFADGDTTGTLTKNTGTYAVSEEAISPATDAQYDESLSCVNKGDQATEDTDGSVTVAKGDAWVCTFTNTRKTGTIKLVKKLNGGGSDRFNLKINGVDQSKSGGGTSFGDGDATAVLTKDTGTYTVTEAAISPAADGDYVEDLSCVNKGDQATEDTDGSVTIAKGDAWVCTFTNTRKTGTIELKKEWKGPDPGTVTIKIGTSGDPSSVASKQLDGVDGTTGQKTVDTGTYTVSETGPNLAQDYNSTLSCTDGEGTWTPQDGQVSVGFNDEIVCTYTNTRKTGTLILQKDLKPASDSGRFNLRHDGTAATVDAPGGGTAFGDGDRSEAITVPAGDPITLSETAVDSANLSDYVRSLSCAVQADARVSADPLDGDQVTVGEDETVVCTFTNVRKAKITVKKVVSNPESGEGPQFTFTSNIDQEDWDTFKLRHTESQSTLVSPDREGSYAVTEEDPSAIDGGYLLTKIDCTDAEGAPTTEFTVDGRTVRLYPAAGADVTCVFTNKRIVGLDVVVKTPKSQAVYQDGTATYTYEVTNTGTSDLTDIAVSDDKCPNVTGPNTNGDASPTVLNPGDKWTYTCSIKASDLFGSTTAPITNTVTVTAKDELGRSVPPAKDTAVTNLLIPGIAIDKSVNPASQSPQAGDPITFDITVSNTGNTSMKTVDVADDLCPSNLSGPDKSSDGTPNTLDPGESWRYSCVVQTTAAQAGQTIRNVATVNGTDTGNKTLTASDDAQVELPAPVTPQSTPRGSSRMTGTSGCVKSAYGTATVTGSNISQVTFYVNGKLAKRLTKPNAGAYYRLKLRAKQLRYGNYKIVAKVKYVTGATPSTATLDRQFSRCRPRVVIKPKFTG